MELTAEINKVFGEEMAKLISAKITDDELLSLAKEAWKNIRYGKENPYGIYSSTPEITKMVQKELLNRLTVEVNSILDSENGQTEIKKDAEEIVQNIRERAKEKMIEGVSDRIAQMTTGYAGFGMRNMVAEIVDDMIGGRR